MSSLDEAPHFSPNAAILTGFGLLGAAAIHGTAAVSHTGSTTYVVLFVVASVVQTIVGLAALVRWSRAIRVAVVVSSIAVTGAWLISRTVGLPGSDIESVGLGDALAVAMQLTATVLAVFVPALSVVRPQPMKAIVSSASVAVALGALALPATLKHGHEEDLLPGSISAVWGSHAHIHTQQASAGLTGNGVVQDQPKACSPTAKEVTDADLLVAQTTIALQRWADPATAVSGGFVPLGFEPNGVYHYLSQTNIGAPAALDPDRPESIVYGRLPNGSLRPIGAMFMVSKHGERGPRPGGCLMTWHTHGWPFAEPGKQSVEMIHIWTIPVPGGPFAHESGPDYARIYLDKQPVSPEEINLLLADLRDRFENKTVDPSTMSAIGVLALGTEESRCESAGKAAMTVLKVSAALQSQVCDPLLNEPVPGAARGGLFTTLGQGLQ